MNSQRKRRLSVKNILKKFSTNISLSIKLQLHLAPKILIQAQREKVPIKSIRQDPPVSQIMNSVKDLNLLILRDHGDLNIQRARIKRITTITLNSSSRQSSPLMITWWLVELKIKGMRKNKSSSSSREHLQKVTHQRAHLVRLEDPHLILQAIKARTKAPQVTKIRIKETVIPLFRMSKIKGR